MEARYSVTKREALSRQWGDNEGQGVWKGELAQGEIFKGRDLDFKNV